GRGGGLGGDRAPRDPLPHHVAGGTPRDRAALRAGTEPAGRSRGNRQSRTLRAVRVQGAGRACALAMSGRPAEVGLDLLQDLPREGLVPEGVDADRELAGRVRLALDRDVDLLLQGRAAEDPAVDPGRVRGEDADVHLLQGVDGSLDDLLRAPLDGRLE